jgi:hypothetical protein
MRFEPSDQQKNDFWHVFITNRVVKRLSSNLKERGYTVSIKRVSAQTKRGFATEWSIGWKVANPVPSTSPSLPNLEEPASNEKSTTETKTV